MIILYILAIAFALDLIANAGSGFNNIVSSFKEKDETKFKNAIDLLSEIDELRDELLDSDNDAESAMLNEKIKDRQKLIELIKSN